MKLGTLGKHRWMIATRGVLAVVLGLAVALWPDITLPEVVALFGTYAVLDGLWAVASAVVVAGPRGGRRDLAVWSVGLEGLVGIGFGTLAIAWPLVSREFIVVVAVWAAATGALEILTAALMPRETAGHWLLGTAGVLSLFLAGLVLMVPRADSAGIVELIAGYAVGFGMLLTAAALQFRAPAARHPVAHRGG